MKILGYTDEKNECDKCGKIELKGVYVIETKEKSIKHLGCTCINHAIEMDENDKKLLKSAKSKRINAISMFDNALKQLTESNEIAVKHGKKLDTEILKLENDIQLKRVEEKEMNDLINFNNGTKERVNYMIHGNVNKDVEEKVKFTEVSSPSKKINKITTRKD